MFRRLVLLTALVAGACGTLEASTGDGSDASDAGEPRDSAGDQGTVVDPGTDAGHEDADAAPVDGKTYFLTVLHPSVEPTCAQAAGCHAVGAPLYQFFGDSGLESYAIFKAHGFDVPDGGFEVVAGGTHVGKDMTEAQVLEYRTWTSLEHP